jgi:4-amino-4-deoxy-L-arabinose transferase-like glycosyltransferase
MSDKPSRLLLSLLVATLTIAARLPFLVTHKIPFDSDEAVEGLMARHVLSGELPAFFWAQAFKGAPEVYASAGVFAIFGSSVIALKSVTLALFAAYVALQFTLLDRIVSRWTAVSAALLLIAAPPALVFWSLDASAEYILIMLLGTTLLLLCLDEQRRRSRLFGIGLTIGIGLWVHQLFVVYLLPHAIILTLQREWWRRRGLGKPGTVVLGLLGVASLYLALGLVAFVTGGFSWQLGPLAVGARAPQKMLRIAVLIAGLAAVAHTLTRTSRRTARDFIAGYWPVMAGLVAGHLPVVLYSLLVEPARSPARNANLRQLVEAAPDIFGNIFPILAGFKIATTERLALPAAAAIPAAVALAAYLWSTRRNMTRDFFPLFVLFVPVLWFASGAYIDTQSYRYLIPWYAGLTVAWAGGSLVLARAARFAPGATRVLASLLVATIFAVHAWQQVLWYRMLQPDSQSISMLACLERNGFRGGYADYWTAYKLTFLAREEIVVAPLNGIDRYPRYTAYVRSLPANERIDDVARCR